MSTNTERLEAARAAMAAKREAGELQRLDPMEKARRNPQSRSLAITAKCWDCIGRNADPNPRQRIRDCPCTDCPLYPLRPWQGIGGASSTGEGDG